MAELRQLLIDKLNSNIAKITECETKKAIQIKTAEITKHYDDIKQQLTKQNTYIMEKYKQIKINRRKKIDGKDSEIPNTIKITADTKIIIDAINDAPDEIKQNIGSTLNIQISQTSTLEQEITPDTYFDIPSNRSQDGIEQWINIKINDYNQSKTDQIIVNSNSKIPDLVIKDEDKVDQTTNWTNISQQTYLLRNYELTDGTKPFENYSVYFAVGDGTCLIHSLLNAISETYRNISSNDYKSFIGRYFRQHIFVNFVKYADTEAGVKAKQILQTNIQSDSFMEDTSIGLFARTFKVNIILFAELYYMDNAGNLILPSHYEIFKESDDDPYIFIYNISGTHFNTIRNGEKFIFNKQDVQQFIDNENTIQPKPNPEPKSESESESESKPEIQNLTFENIIKLTPSQIQNSNEDYLKKALSIIYTTDINTINYNSDELKHKLQNVIRLFTFQTSIIYDEYTKAHIPEKTEDEKQMDAAFAASLDSYSKEQAIKPNPESYKIPEVTVQRYKLIQNKHPEPITEKEKNEHKLLNNKTWGLLEYVDAVSQHGSISNQLIHKFFKENDGWTITIPNGDGNCLAKAVFSSLVGNPFNYEKAKLNINPENILINGLKHRVKYGYKTTYGQNKKIPFMIELENGDIITIQENINDNTLYEITTTVKTKKDGIDPKKPKDEYTDTTEILDEANMIKNISHAFIVINVIDQSFVELFARGLGINILVLSNKGNQQTLSFWGKDGNTDVSGIDKINASNSIILTLLFGSHFCIIDNTDREKVVTKIKNFVNEPEKWIL